MELRAFNPDADFERIKGWITDERAHAMWCANRFAYPLAKGDFLKALSDMAQKTGDVSLIADIGGKAAGFFCYSLKSDSGEGVLKFVIVDPDCRGKGVAREMLGLAVSHAFRDTGAESVRLIVFSVNERARRCYEKAGFTEKHTDSKAFAFGDELWDRCHMAITK